MATVTMTFTDVGDEVDVVGKSDEMMNVPGKRNTKAMDLVLEIARYLEHRHDAELVEVDGKPVAA